MSLIYVNNIGKAYRTYNSEWQRFARWFYLPVSPCREDWTIRNVSFRVNPGESVAIVGENGAGKSTLLKMITGTLRPTEGNVHISGSVGAILELGMGFLPDLTGRENAIHTSGLMGYSDKRIKSAISEIERFSEIGKYFDEPVRTYSSGMQMRVAFSVATAFSPDLLIIDEALSVGDSYFQQKCFSFLDSYMKQGGSLLFVSHDVGAVKSLCDRAVLIDQGRLVKDGSPKEVVDLYEGIISQRSDLGSKELTIVQENKTDTALINATTITTNGDAELLEFNVLDENDKNVLYIESEKKLKVNYKVRLNKFFERPAFGIIIRDKYGSSMFEISSYAMGIEYAPIEKDKIVNVVFEFNFNLRQGQYSFSIGVSNKGYARTEFEEISLLMHDVKQIQVIECPNSINYGGVYNMNPMLSVFESK
ncbi:ABC transporter ATP-binding protein [Aestuariicella sp. G3-2]|uniref:ABC transporter ATP-binding protein n=1 Tax=Pseudomaricurvus albidus TaxID=2842452 RepID=UPI001C0DE0DB|nr:ABC transporter ATP-binding protein [Aestuariicella albida]MBU3071656.1 ABC transporter ATP-binding protein [Aestuariicella albida]